MDSLKYMYLHLERNKLGDSFAGLYGENLFKGLKKLGELYLMDNDIRALPGSILKDQISLKILKIGENKLSGWGTNLFIVYKESANSGYLSQPDRTS